MSETHPNTPSRGRWAWLAVMPAVLVWLVGQTARDATWLTGLCFYVPTPVIAGWLLAVAVREVIVRRRRTALTIAALALPPLCLAVFVENRPFATRPVTTAAGFRIVHWNVASRLRWSGAIDVMLPLRADVHVLSEAGHPDGVVTFCEILGDDFQAAQFAGLAVVARGSLRVGETLLEQRRTMVQLVDWDHAERTLKLMIVDLPSELNVARDPVLREINALIEQHQPDLVIGDFNAPRRSWGLSQLPDGYRHAFETAGRGCGYTWPAPIPVLAIDQCVTGPRIAPVNYELRTSLASDHRLQVFDGAWR
ncbi:MAG TPA: endonuclease/exonuclease/phosphatase family protein [Planctomycetaceae bacterium]|nr:endonuclease/exonuclease/phosphatase family protein [Planctomycetaceae bacterium]